MALHLQSTIAPSILQPMKNLNLLLLALASLVLFSCDPSHIGENERDKIVRRHAEEAILGLVCLAQRDCAPLSKAMTLTGL